MLMLLLNRCQFNIRLHHSSNRSSTPNHHNQLQSANISHLTSNHQSNMSHNLSSLSSLNTTSQNLSIKRLTSRPNQFK